MDRKGERREDPPEERPRWFRVPMNHRIRETGSQEAPEDVNHERIFRQGSRAKENTEGVLLFLFRRRDSCDSGFNDPRDDRGQDSGPKEDENSCNFPV